MYVHSIYVCMCVPISSYLMSLSTKKVSSYVYCVFHFHFLSKCLVNGATDGFALSAFAIEKRVKKLPTSGRVAPRGRRWLVCLFIPIHLLEHFMEMEAVKGGI